MNRKIPVILGGKMVKVYFNYPTSRVTAHRNPVCSSIQVMKRPSQRICHINVATFSAELKKFIDKRYRFKSEGGLNDMWIEINFSDDDFEIAIARYILRILAQHYEPFYKSKLKFHC